MPLKNYTTSVSATRTVGQIQEILAQAGARNVSISYDDQGLPRAVEFSIVVQGRPINYRLPSNWRGVQKALKENGVYPYQRTDEQSRNVAWRNIKDWVDAQLALIETQQASLPELFFPHAVDPRSGKTLYQTVMDSGYLLEDKEGNHG